ncbi:EboA domain-containing protein [Streptomyces sulphureus]|uniref:EboA domain-containing protein n=1 Tax=Streptomyces sulphureus TaxID=47758 RepID=UPI00036C6BE1|nr:EboA domain-containing protein [Streptomyces sulphureus]
MLTPLATLRTALELRLDAAARTWLHTALSDAGEADQRELPRWERHFAAAGRRCATAEGPAHHLPAADAARVLLLHAAGVDADTATRLYREGTADERRAVLHALPHLDLGDAGLPLVADALRTNDTRLVAAAVGPYAAERLDAHAWRQAVLKCLFTQVPLSAVAELPARAAGDAELARMLRDFARERTAAGRPVPEDLDRALALAESPSEES